VKHRLGRAVTLLAMLVVAFGTFGFGCSLTWGEECTPETSICEGNVWMYCASQRVWVRTDCGEHSCIADPKLNGRGSRCAFSSSQDPLCLSKGPDWTGDVCEENHSVACSVGYRMTETDCGDRHCVDNVESPGTQCALSDGQDPLCVAHHKSYGYLCDGNLRIECRHYARVSEEDCGSRTCVFPDFCIRDHNAACVLSPVPDPLCEENHWGGCDGASAIGCHCGFRTSERTCASCETDTNGYVCR